MPRGKDVHQVIEAPVPRKADEPAVVSCHFRRVVVVRARIRREAD